MQQVDGETDLLEAATNTAANAPSSAQLSAPEQDDALAAATPAPSSAAAQASFN